MSHLIPFRGVLYNPDRVDDISRVVAPPYDMISPGEQRALHDGDPFNLVRLTLGYGFPEETEEDNRYTRAAKTMESWLGKRVLVRDDEPSIYVYDQEYSLGEGQNYLRRGFIALAHLEDFGGGRIFPTRTSAPSAGNRGARNSGGHCARAGKEQCEKRL